jgi:hypothetical protein
MWYHFAFMAISIAMLGMTTGAVLVYKYQQKIDRDPLHYFRLSAVACALAIVFSFLVHLSIPFQSPKELVAIIALAITFACIAMPFVASGVGITIALTKFGTSVKRLYAADLVGAGVGCLLFFLLLTYVDGPSAVLINAGIVGLVGLGLSQPRWLKLVPIALLVIGAANAITFNMGKPLVRLVWIKGGLDPKPLYETWNSYSRIAVYDDPLIAGKPFGWGLSSKTVLEDSVPKQLLLNIDAGAGTVLTGFNGDLRSVNYLKYDLTNFAHYLRPNSDVLALGAGGGRDLLSALVFDQHSVTGVEINKAIVNALDVEFARFTGLITKHPKVKLVNQEARNFIARSKGKYDIIQVSLIDTWAATAAGAFALSENSLYTREAWIDFIAHLTDRGVLTFSRWWVKDNPAEIYRLVSLASSALRGAGIADPRKHILLVRNDVASSGGPDGIGTILVSKQPFSSEEISTSQAICDSLDFTFALSPQHTSDNNLALLTTEAGAEQVSRATALRLSAPTDNDPFFFHVVDLSSVFSGKMLTQGGVSFNMKAVLILLVSAFIVLALTFLFIVLPLRKSADGKLGPVGRKYLFYFAMIGLAFMLVEISQIQALNIYLGHPVLSLTVALFSILIASGIGSFYAGTTEKGKLVRLALIPVTALIIGIATPGILEASHSAELFTRIAVSVGLLFPLGFFMGMAFPIGMDRARTSEVAKFSPWFWGVNGATSVCGSVLAMLFSLSYGISSTYFIGVAIYAGVVILFYRLSSSRSVSLPHA